MHNWKSTRFLGCLCIAGVLILGLMTDVSAQEANSTGKDSESVYDLDSVATSQYQGLGKGDLMIGGRGSLRFEKDEVYGRRQSDLIIAPRVYYFMEKGWAMGILFQIESHSTGYSRSSAIGIGTGNAFYIDLGNALSYLTLDVSFLLMMGGGSDLQIQFGPGFSQFITREIALNASFDVIYYGIASRSFEGNERGIEPDLVRFQIGVSYFIR